MKKKLITLICFYYLIIKINILSFVIYHVSLEYKKYLTNQKIFFCKRCLTSFDNQSKVKLSGQDALEQHKLICGPHKPILPILPKEGTMLEFEGWNESQRHPVVIYADFEAFLLKSNEKKGKNTLAFQSHQPMSYGFYVKASDDVPKELLEKFNIPQTPIIFRGSEFSDEVAKTERLGDELITVGKICQTSPAVLGVKR